MNVQDLKPGDRLIAKQEINVYSDDFRRMIIPKGITGIIVKIIEKNGDRYFRTFWQKSPDGKGVWANLRTFDVKSETELVKSK